MLSLYIFKYNNQHTGTQEKKNHEPEETDP